MFVLTAGNEIWLATSLTFVRGFAIFFLGRGVAQSASAQRLGR